MLFYIGIFSLINNYIINMSLIEWYLKNEFTLCYFNFISYVFYIFYVSVISFNKVIKAKYLYIFLLLV
jgi:hypothetical protein